MPTQPSWPRSKNPLEYPKQSSWLSHTSTWNVLPKSLSACCQHSSPSQNKRTDLDHVPGRISTQPSHFHMRRGSTGVVTPSKSPESVPDIYYKCQALSPMLFLSGRLISWDEKGFVLFFQISGDFSPHWLVCGGYLYIMRYLGDKTPNLDSFMLHIYLIIAITSRQFHAIFSIMSDTKCHDVTLWFPVQIVGNFGAFWVFQVFDCSICILCHTFYTKFSG